MLEIKILNKSIKNIVINIETFALRKKTCPLILDDQNRDLHKTRLVKNIMPSLIGRRPRQYFTPKQRWSVRHSLSISTFRHQNLLLPHFQFSQNHHQKRFRRSPARAFWQIIARAHLSILEVELFNLVY